MASPPDIFAHVRVGEAMPSKMFTVQEANRLVPTLEQIFHEMDNRQIRLREVEEFVQDLEAYWGGQLADPECPDRRKHVDLVDEREDIHASLEEDLQRIYALGAVLKDYGTGLVDFYGYVDDELVFLCWQRGEPEIRFFHPLEGGYAGRRPLARVPQK